MSPNRLWKVTCAFRMALLTAGVVDSHLPCVTEAEGYITGSYAMMSRELLNVKSPEQSKLRRVGLLKGLRAWTLEPRTA